MLKHNSQGYRSVCGVKLFCIQTIWDVRASGIGGLCLRDRKGEMEDFTLSNNHILCTLGARGFLREEPQSAISEA